MTEPGMTYWQEERRQLKEAILEAQRNTNRLVIEHTEKRDQVWEKVIKDVCEPQSNPAYHRAQELILGRMGRKKNG